MDKLPNRREVARRNLFRLYANNWSIVKRHPSLHVTPDLDDVFVCPLCLKSFTSEALSHPNVLSLEHVPPGKLGGSHKDWTLTCTHCNNAAGILEGRLAKKMQVEDVMNGIPGTSIDGEYTIVADGEEIWLPVTLRISPEGWELIGYPNRSNPKLLQQVLNKKFEERVTGFKFRYTGKSGSPAVALLKTAYLFIFRLFGYGVIVHPVLQTVREQIQEPTGNILPRSWLVNWELPDHMLGVNVITQPSNLRMFLVVFDLYSGKRTRRYGVILPGPNELGLEVYDYVNPEFGPEMRAKNILDSEEYLKNPHLAFYSHQLWM